MKILDIFKRKNNNTVAVKKNDLTSEKILTDTADGVYSLAKWLPNPDVVLKNAGKKITVLKNVKADGQVATCITSRKAGVLSRNVVIKHANPEVVDFYANLFKKINIRNVISDILNAPLFGYQPIEITWSEQDGYILPFKIEAKPPEWFKYNKEHEFCFLEKGNPDGLTLKDEDYKWLIPVRNKSYENPYGEALLSLCFWSVAFKKGGMSFWLKFIERFGMPFITGKYDPAASEDEKEALISALTNLFSDAVAIMPMNSTTEIQEAGGKSTSADLYEKFCRLQDGEISKIILGGTLTTDISDKGSYAASKTHMEVRKDIIEDDCKLCEAELNKLVRYIHDLNFNDTDYPIVELKEDEDIGKDVADRDLVLKNTGVNFTKKYFQKTYGFDDDEIEVIKSENNSNSDFAEYTISQNPQKKIDEFMDSFDDSDFDAVVADCIKPIIKEFADLQDPQKTLDNLADIYPKMSTKELENTLTKVIFLAQVYGRLQQKKEREQKYTKK